ncbi:MAG: DNA topoisomerase (ATP-hydrolyzing) subunit B [Thermoplasmata archaeon]|nr:DNA topoisomerase (ATP-hydrolyzing) subunit B [Thermoplasmata archaeon]
MKYGIERGKDMENGNMSYKAEDIQVLNDTEAVRKRPGMYIGSTDEKGLHHLLLEVVDNSIDEALAGVCKNIIVKLYPDGSASVEDDGRGIPVDIHPLYNKPALEIVLTELHSGAKFDKKVYKVSGGLHGVGIHVVNFLSEYFRIIVKRDGKIYSQEYERGQKKSDIVELGQIEKGKIKIDDKIELELESPTGTFVYFKPDPEIFETKNFNYDIVKGKLRSMAFLNKGLRIVLKDLRNGNVDEFKYDGGIVEFVKFLNEGVQPIHNDVAYFSDEENQIQVEIALQYNDQTYETVLGYVNDIQTEDGGTHVVGFKTGITKVLNDYAKENNLLKNLTITGEDVREGLTAVILVKHPEPQFEGQTKTKLGNSEVKGIVYSMTLKHMKKYLEEHPASAKSIIAKVLNTAMAREAARKARDLVRRKNLLDILDLPGKLADCSIEDKEKTEIFIVEGDSAGGSAKQARNREFQAILPLRGKILNVEKANVDRAFRSDEIKALISAIGTGINDDFDINKLRYGKIIIMTDADVDGAHIRTLLLTFFYRYMKELVNQGHIYIAQPPLYRIQKGNDVRYVYSDEEKDALIKEMGENAIVQRFKGLGEMNPQQLWETTMNPDTRRILKIDIETASEADRLFSLLMGDQVEPRREYIIKHAREVMNLDI